MAHYVVLAWPATSETCVTRVAALDALMERDPAWRLIERRQGLRVWAPRGAATPVHGLPGGRDLLIGEVHGLGAAVSSAPGRDATPAARAHWLSHSVWGGYVALFFRHEGASPSIFRDPSGACPCLIWRTGGITVVASGLFDWLLVHLRPLLSLDWGRVAGFLADPVSIVGPPALDGVREPAAGQLIIDPDRDAAEVIWTPGLLAAGWGQVDAAPETLAAIVDGCVEAMAVGSGGILAEVSGGLDSSIVASALYAGGIDVQQWLNLHALEGQGDERVYARALADHLGVVLTEARKPSTTLDEADLRQGALDVRPGLGRLDMAHERDLAARCRRLGVQTVFTGQGGDAVFFHRATPLILADMVRELGLAALTPRRVTDLAQWSRRSAWSVLGGLVRRNALRMVRPPDYVLLPVQEHQDERASHPWLEGLTDVSPAKQLQIYSLTQMQLVRGPWLGGPEVQLKHPLLAQPVVEHVLALSSFALTEGRRDRALARRAYASRLPEQIVSRRSKGDLTSHYSRMTAASLPMLRPFLLDGLLAERGLLDRDRLDAVLTPEQCFWKGEIMGVLTAAVVEAWVRRWRFTPELCVTSGA